MRDLGMTLEEFNAAGDQGKRAADAVSVLQGLPGYLGTSLKDGRILVAGSGPELQAQVDELNRAGKAGDEFVLFQTPVPERYAPTDAPAPAAEAPAAPTLVAVSTEQLYEAYIREVGPAGLQAVIYTDGQFVIRTDGTTVPRSAASVTEFVGKYSNVRLEEGRPLEPEEDFFGGQGYVLDTGAICSAGFGAFSPTGQPLVLTAGHCTDDGAAKLARLEFPTWVTGGVLGTVGFSQFGGTGNTPDTGTQPNLGNVGTDIAVIQSIRADLNVQPAATKWDSGADPGATAVKIVGMASPFVGQPVCRSGRTLHWSCGTVDEIGIHEAVGRNDTAGTPDVRAFKGFASSSVKSRPGDSGGPWISGNYAIGTHTGGIDDGNGNQLKAVAATLEDAVAKIPGGLQLQVFLNKPELASSANGGSVAAGDVITGQVVPAPATAVPANSRVRVTIAGRAPLEVPVDADGLWSFTAPEVAGQLRFSAETVNGFSASGASTFEVAVTPSGLPAPVFITPGENAVLTAVARFEGTGTAGATVELSGDASGSGVVGLDGRWSIPVAGNPVFGRLSVRAVQTSPGTPMSPATVRKFTAVPPAPGVTNIRDGQSIEQNSVPQSVTGTGLGAATVNVMIDGAALPQVTVAGGIWSVGFPAGLEPGAHTLAVSQAMDGVVSAVTTRGFTIVAAPVPVVPPSVSVVLPAGDAGGAGFGSGWLPDTGASAVLPVAGIAGGALLFGGLLLMLVRRRTRP